MKSTLEAEKTARVHRLFGASNYVNRADKAEKFSGNSSVFKWKNRKISSSKRAKYYGHWKHYMCSWSSTFECMIPFISKMKKLSKRVNGLHEIKRLVWRILVVIVRLFKSKNRKNYSTSSNETTSKLKVLPQRKNFGCELRNSTTLISLGIDWTIISIHFPINKSRAHGSVSSRFAGGLRFGISGSVITISRT